MTQLITPRCLNRIDPVDEAGACFLTHPRGKRAGGRVSGEKIANHFTNQRRSRGLRLPVVVVRMLGLRHGRLLDRDSHGNERGKILSQRLIIPYPGNEMR